MDLGHKIYNDLVNRKMTRKNGYSGVFEYYPEITVALLLEHVNKAKQRLFIKSSKEIICGLIENSVSCFFEYMCFPSDPEWLYKNQIISDYKISKKAVENKAVKVLDIICGGIDKYDNYEDLASNYGDRREYFETVTIVAEEENREVSKEELAIFCITKLFREDFFTLLYQILDEKYNIEFSI